jgi:hypothetical protein
MAAEPESAARFITFFTPRHAVLRLQPINAQTQRPPAGLRHDSSIYRFLRNGRTRIFIIGTRSFCNYGFTPVQKNMSPSLCIIGYLRLLHSEHQIFPKRQAPPPKDKRNTGHFSQRVAVLPQQKHVQKRSYLIKLTVIRKTPEPGLPDDIIRAMRERESRFND